MDVDLTGQVAVVTGASRGAGKAVAEVLGEAGATVYVTGRSVRGEDTTDGMPGTIQDTAEAVTGRGGEGIPIRCDHTVDRQVEALVRRVESERGRLDLLVNNAWGGYERYGEKGFDAPFWEQPAWRWDGMFEAGVRTHWATTRFAAPLLMDRGSGLVVGTVAWAFGAYLGNLLYDAAKAATVRMYSGMARELEPHGVTALALTPGFMRTERVMAAHEVEPFDLGGTESPEYLGRAVVALAGDAAVAERSGSLLTVGDLAREFGFTDVDGTQPAPFRIPESGAEGGEPS